MSSGHEEKFGPEILDVNHFDSMVWIRFTDGTCVKLSAKQVLKAASSPAPEREAESGNGQAISTA
ncbi:hypothetical protein [Terriglobus sp.]|uniref:hypothetical protein n=1 Tax=Terriglobus sp. TaxID=1889013 RepID=UPI003B008298